MSQIAIIPARGGSKRIPRKNLKLFCGKPIISYSIELAYQSQLFDKVFVSTDDDEIAAVANQYGAEVPFKRPASLADDYSPTIPVISHAIGWLEKNGWDLDMVCCIYPTAPLLHRSDLIGSHEIFKTGKWDYVFAGTEYAFPIQRSFKLDNEGGVEMLYPEQFVARSQDLEILYHDAGQFYWGQIGAWMDQRPFFTQNSTMFKIPKYRVVDIDNLDDWKRAEMGFQYLRN